MLCSNARYVHNFSLRLCQVRSHFLGHFNDGLHIELKDILIVVHSQVSANFALFIRNVRTGVVDLKFNKWREHRLLTHENIDFSKLLGGCGNQKILSFG